MKLATCVLGFIPIIMAANGLITMMGTQPHIDNVAIPLSVFVFLAILSTTRKTRK